MASIFTLVRVSLKISQTKLRSFGNASISPLFGPNSPMYGPPQSMSIPSQIPGGSGVAAGAVDVSVGADDHHLNYDRHSAFENGVVVVREDVAHDSAYATTGDEFSNSCQLTLSFGGQVYVFDSVTPDKVQAVLLLLGGCELSSGPQGMEVIPHYQRGFAECPGRCTQPQRAASLDRFRQKRKERCFDKKVRYGVRQEVALRKPLMVDFCGRLHIHNFECGYYVMKYMQQIVTNVNILKDNFKGINEYTMEDITQLRDDWAIYVAHIITQYNEENTNDKDKHSLLFVELMK